MFSHKKSLTNCDQIFKLPDISLFPVVVCRKKLKSQNQEDEKSRKKFRKLGNWKLRVTDKIITIIGKKNVELFRIKSPKLELLIINTVT